MHKIPNKEKGSLIMQKEAVEDRLSGVFILNYAKQLDSGKNKL